MSAKAFVRNTKQREAILEVLRSTDSHPTADWVYQEVRKKLPNVSLGTIYRNLRTLADSGEIMELVYGSSYSRFDRNPKNHYHFLCRKCGRVFDVNLPADDDLNRRASEATGHYVDSHRLEFFGICTECKTDRVD